MILFFMDYMINPLKTSTRMGYVYDGSYSKYFTFCRYRHIYEGTRSLCSYEMSVTFRIQQKYVPQTLG